MKTRNFLQLATATMLTFIGFGAEVKGQTHITIGSAVQVLSGGMQVSVGPCTLVNNGSYTDTSGTFNILGGSQISGSGTTTFNDLNINGSGLSRFYSLVSVNRTSNIIAGDFDANNNLFVRSDLSTAANMVVSGVLTGNVQGLVTRPTVSVAPCPSYSSDLSLNVSGPVMLYQWQSSPDNIIWTDIAAATNATHSALVTVDGYYRCNLKTTNSTYAQPTQSVQLLLTGVPAPVTVSGSGPHCAQATLLATGGAGGDIYYEGVVSGGTSTLNLIDTALVTASGTYYFRSRSTAGCWGPQDSAQVVINPYVTPNVSVATSPGLHVCQGTTAIFTASPANGGATPSYHWRVNGATTGGSSDTFSYIPNNGDVVNVVLTSSAPCPTIPTAADSAVMIVDSNYVPLVSIAVSPGVMITHGQYDTLTALVAGGGATPTYQWLINGIAMPGATSSVYITNSLLNNDSVTCVVTGAGVCALPSFNSLKISVRTAGIANLISGSNFSILPNPNSGAFQVKGLLPSSAQDYMALQVTNVLGQTVYEKNVRVTNGSVNELVDLGDVANGIYILSLMTEGERAVFHIVVSR